MLMSCHFIFLIDKLSLMEDREDDSKMGRKIFVRVFDLVVSLFVCFKIPLL